MLSFWSPLFNVSYTMFPSSHFINDSFIYSSIRCLVSNYSMPGAVPYVEDSVVSKTRGPWITHVAVSCTQAVLGCLILLLWVNSLPLLFIYFFPLLLCLISCWECPNTHLQKFYCFWNLIFPRFSYTNLF